MANLQTGSVSKCSDSGVLREDGPCGMVSIGGVIYLIGNCRPFDPTKARSGSDMLNYGCDRFSPQQRRTSAGWCIDLSNSKNCWKPVPNYKSLDDVPLCASLKGKIYLFGCGIRDTWDGPFLSLAPGEVYDPCRGLWDELPVPEQQESDLWAKYVTRRLLVDEVNNRLLIHFSHLNCVYAYYPDQLKWERLFTISAFVWSHISVVADGMLLIHSPKSAGHFIAFDLNDGRWLNASVSVSVSDFNYNYLYWYYDALFPLNAPATFCLATPQLDFLVFTVARSSSGDALINIVSSVSLQVDDLPDVFNYLPIGSSFGKGTVEEIS